MFHKNRAVLAFLVLPLAIAISGCDRHKAERAELGQKITALDAELIPLQDEKNRVSQEVQTLDGQVQQASDALQPHLDLRAKLQDELAVFVEEHKTTALVLKMTNTGVATVLDSKADEKTKKIIGTADAISKLVAVAYCFRKGPECRNSTLKIMALGSQIDSENKTISTMTAQLDETKASLQELQQKSASIDATIAAKTQERDSLKQRLESIS